MLLFLVADLGKIFCTLSQTQLTTCGPSCNRRHSTSVTLYCIVTDLDSANWPPCDGRVPTTWTSAAAAAAPLVLWTRHDVRISEHGPQRERHELHRYSLYDGK